MKIEVGMYARYEYEENVYIGKIKFISEVMCGLNETLQIDIDNCMEEILKKDILKASHNILDLIEVGDVLLLFAKEYDEKYKAEVILDSEDFKSIVDYEQTNLLNLEYELITEEHIKLLSILTKEQFESMSYKVGE